VAGEFFAGVDVPGRNVERFIMIGTVDLDHIGTERVIEEPGVIETQDIKVPLPAQIAVFEESLPGDLRETGNVSRRDLLIESLNVSPDHGSFGNELVCHAPYPVNGAWSCFGLDEKHFRYFLNINPG
jgi:hypothetical protein